MVKSIKLKTGAVTGVWVRIPVLEQDTLLKLLLFTQGYILIIIIYSAISLRTITIHVIANKIMVKGKQKLQNMLNRAT